MSKNIQKFSAVFSFLAFAGVLTLLSMQFFTPKKMAYVQSDILLEKYQGMIDAKNDYQQKAVQWQANIDTLGAELENMINNYEANKNKLTQNTQLQTEKEITTKQQQFKKYQQVIGQQAEKEDQELTAGVLNQVNTYLEGYGKKKGYRLIFGANGSGNIVYGADAIDITEEVLIGLNKEYEGE